MEEASKEQAGAEGIVMGTELERACVPHSEAGLDHLRVGNGKPVRVRCMSNS